MEWGGVAHPAINISKLCGGFPENKQVITILIRIISPSENQAYIRKTTAIA